MSHSGSFGITTPAEFFDQLLLPQHRDFLSDNSSRFALTCAVFGYHLYEWVNTAPGKDFKADFKGRYSSHPAKDHLAEMFDLARRLTNGTKHFGNRVGTGTQSGFSSAFSSAFRRPLYVIRDDGSQIGADELLREIVDFWVAEHAAGAF
jgi:hypothetical protein